MAYFLTLDVGTTAVKAALFSHQLKLVALCGREYALETPRADWVEVDPNVYWQRAAEAVRDVLAASGVGAADIASITCATQGETLIPVDEAGCAVHNAIVWLDARAKEESVWLRERLDRLALYRATGLPEINGYTPVAKLLWIKRHLPDVYARTAKFLLLEDYLLCRLTGHCVTNPTLLCTTGYFDIQQGALWRQSLALCGLDAQKIPDILPCGTVVGPLQARAAAEFGLDARTVATTGAMDQVASAVGSGNTVCGVVTETTGTCQAVAATVDQATFRHWSPVTYYSHAMPGKLLQIVINQTAGIAYKWFRDEFCRDLTQTEGAFAAMDALAAGAPALSRGLIFFPHMTGMQFPVTDEGARGVFFGMGLDTGRDCFIRAVMEGVGYMLRESLHAMGLVPQRVISLGGGAKSGVWGQIKADICGVNFCIPQDQESTSLGAAMLGGCAVGTFADLQAAAGQVAIRRSFAPDAAQSARYEAGYTAYSRMYEQFAPLFAQGEKIGEE
ncbi:MAG: hypothetical protein LBU67_05085 [Oscillospiraceae bacterium]|jgi:xylulokinase|nr:hypothetical protein [Oscillospiraceae bacterium]